VIWSYGLASIFEWRIAFDGLSAIPTGGAPRPESTMPRGSKLWKLRLVPFLSP
jgi:hypothetical protein